MGGRGGKEKIQTPKSLKQMMTTRTHLSYRDLGFVSDLRGNIKILGNHAHIFVPTLL